VVHAVPAAKDVINLYADEAAREKLIHQATDKLREIQECVGSAARVSILAEEVAFGVCGVAGREKADLLVIGRSVTEGMLGRLKANAYSIIRQSPCPVVSV